MFVVSFAKSCFNLMICPNSSLYVDSSLISPLGDMSIFWEANLFISVNAFIIALLSIAKLIFELACICEVKISSFFFTEA